MELTDLANLIKSRRSVRKWQERAVPEELLLQAIDLATWAPNGGNQQNWHFYVIVNRSTIKAMADAVQATSDMVNSWPEAGKLGLTPGTRPAGFFRQAPAVIAVASSQYQTALDRVLAAREKTDSRANQLLQWRRLSSTRVQSAGAAIAHLLLILHQMGLGTVWMTGPMQAKGEIEKILHVPPELDVLALIPVGYPAESPTTQGRKPVAEVCEIVR